MSLTIFCNSCFEIQAEIKRKFLITSCSHVLCEPCLASSTNFCPLCKTQCKILEISKQMPAEVKAFFEEDSIKKLARNIEKIRSFLENQVKIYHEKTKPYGEKYNQYKDSVKTLSEKRNSYLEVMRKEKEIMNRLKEAYRANVITPDLFDLSSQKLASPLLPSSASPAGNFSMPFHRTSTSGLSSGPASSTSSIRSTPSHPSGSSTSHAAAMSSTSPSISNIYSKMNLQPKMYPVKKRPSPLLAEQSHFNPHARQNLLQTTLRQMQEASQRKHFG